MRLSGRDLDKINKLLALLNDQGGVSVDLDRIPLVDYSYKAGALVKKDGDFEPWTYDPEVAT